MLKLKDIQTKPVIYQGLEVDVPVDTNFMWLHHTPVKTVLLASPKKPIWNEDRKFYIATSGSNLVAVLEHADLTAEQVKDSLEANEDKPTEQDLEQLDVVVNLIKNLRSFANTLERNVNKATLTDTSESIQELLQHVYADEGELDTFITSLILEAEEFGIDTGADYEEDEDTDEDHEALLKFISSIIK